jgi:hypothetical protein
LLHEAQQPCAVATARLYSDALKLTEGSHPGEHLAITLPGDPHKNLYVAAIVDEQDRVIETRCFATPTMRRSLSSITAILSLRL